MQITPHTLIFNEPVHWLVKCAQRTPQGITKGQNVGLLCFPSPAILTRYRPSADVDGRSVARDAPYGNLKHRRDLGLNKGRQADGQAGKPAAMTFGMRVPCH